MALHIADDGSPPGHVEALRELAGGYPHLVSIGSTNAERGGYGRSYNLASQAVHPGTDYVLPLEDDWQLAADFDLDPLVAALEDPEAGIGCIRLGYLGFTQRLFGEVVHTPAGPMLRFDEDSTEPHVAAGHPRLESVAWERTVGPWVEGIPAGATEVEWCSRKAARNGVAWPMDVIRPNQHLFAHIGAESLGELYPEGILLGGAA